MLILVWERAQGSRTITGEPLVLQTSVGASPWPGSKQPRLRSACSTRGNTVSPQGETAEVSGFAAGRAKLRMITLLSQEKTMWTKPEFTEMRFGFEVTMYIYNR
jgi:pyrroloquinoline quinone biosynthesis protein A